MKKIYVLSARCDYYAPGEDWSIIGYFSTKELADEMIKKYKKLGKSKTGYSVFRVKEQILNV